MLFLPYKSRPLLEALQCCLISFCVTIASAIRKREMSTMCGQHRSEELPHGDTGAAVRPASVTFTESKSGTLASFTFSY